MNKLRKEKENQKKWKNRTAELSRAYLARVRRERKQLEQQKAETVAATKDLAPEKEP